MSECDVAIVGGGPAGLQCALLLARARREVAVIDRGQPRNASVREAHGFFTRDRVTPNELLTLGREQLGSYGNVTFRTSTVTRIEGERDAFELLLDDGDSLRAQRIVLATGMRDRLPDINGLDACWGCSAFVCPYCDGWEVRDQPIAVWGSTRSGTSLARELYQWSHDLLICSDLATPLAEDDRRWIAEHGVRLKEASIARLHHDGGALQSIEFDDGERIAREALFLSVALAQCCDLAESMGCRLTTRGHIDIDAECRTSVPGVYAAGDCVTHMHQIVFAAASGARAAIAVNSDLLGIA